jgi:hypothetical protein
MSLLDPLTGVLRSALGAAERTEPVRDALAVEDRLEELTEAMCRSAESAERHIAVIDELAKSLPPLTEALTVLTAQLNELLKALAPVEAIERDAGRLEHLFVHRRHHDEPPDEPA